MCLHPNTTPHQVPTCNPSHIKQKTKIANNKSRSTSATLQSKLQTPNSPAFTLHKITSETPNKNLQACFTDLHDLPNYVSKLKTNLCNHLTFVFQQNQRINIYLQFFNVQNLVQKGKCPKRNGTQKRNLSCLNKQTICQSIKAISSFHVLPLGDDILKREIANRVHTP
jgi:hypothetical protein